jgi:hypothetical protein
MIRDNGPVKMFWNASSTLLASRADVSIKDKWFSPVHGSINKRSLFGVIRQDQCILAKDLASSVGTALRCRKSLLFPTSMITMLASA